MECLETRMDKVEDDMIHLQMCKELNINSPPQIEYGKFEIPNDTDGIFIGTPYKTDNYGNSINSYIGIPKRSDGHLAVIGGSGSGKSSGIAKPTLKSYHNALCVIDIKGEPSKFYDELKTKGAVKRPYFVFNPANPKSPSYDVFGWVKEDDPNNALANIKQIALALIPESNNNADRFWTDCEREIMTAALYYYYKLGLNFTEAVCMILSVPIFSLCYTLNSCNDPLVKMIAGDTNMLDPKQLTSIGRGIRNYLSCFSDDPCISHAFRGDSEGALCFSWNDLDNYNIFLQIPEDRIENWSGPINILLTQLLQHLMRRPDIYSPEGKNVVPVFMLLDEIARFGKISLLSKAISTLRSKNVVMCLMLQSTAQLDKYYGDIDRRIILDNCSYKAILRAGDPDAQKYLSQIIGTELKVRFQSSESNDSTGEERSYTRQRTESIEPIIQPHELAFMKDIFFVTPDDTKKVKKFCTYDISGDFYAPSKRSIHCMLNGKKANAELIDDIKSNEKNIADQNKFIIKEEIKMISVNERIEKAKNIQKLLNAIKRSMLAMIVNLPRITKTSSIILWANLL